MDETHFFCASMVTMFARLTGGKPNTPPPSGAPTNLTQNQANAALVNALHKVANVKLRNALKLATQAATASGAEKNKKIAELQAAINAAKVPVVAATAAGPLPVEPSTTKAEASATNAVASLITNISIGNFNKGANINVVAIKNNTRYSTVEENRIRIEKAINNRRLKLPASASNVPVK